jgi:hypothetical protein
VPGCAARNVDVEASVAPVDLQSRRVALGAAEDVHEAVFARGWTDGLPVVPPTERRVAAMLAGTVRPADEVIAVMPPALADVTVEKVAVNAVMAGCRPEYLPVVLVTTTAFADAVAAQAGALASTPRHVLVAHPIQNRTDAEVRALADAALDGVIAQLRASP